MAWGTINVGSMALKETDILQDVTNANTGVRSVRFEGAETNPGATLAELQAKQEDIMGLLGRVFPVSFSRKSQYDGYYRATDTNSELEKWVQGPMQVRWSLSLDFIGPENALDFESIMSNVVRANDFSLTGERWHAPPIGHHTYYVGSASPSSISRASSDGSITVYRSIPAGINPVWGCPVASYQVGRVRFIANSVARHSAGINVATTGWEMNNALVRVRPGGAGQSLLVALYDSGVWREKAWDIRIGSASSDTLVPATHFHSVSVLRLDPECATVRIIARQPSNGSRVILDLTLRRGSRLLEGLVQRTASGEVGVILDTSEPTTVGTGYVNATSYDADGNKFTVGTARTFVSAAGGLTKASVTRMDFYISAEKTGAVAGDTLSTLRDQYIGTMSEKVGVVRR